MTPISVHHVADRGLERAVYIGRGSKWGNPFVIGRHGNREEVIDQYGSWLLTQTHLLASLHELWGKQLVCFCAPLACHGDILACMADAQLQNYNEQF
jgi:hypothetical protein